MSTTQIHSIYNHLLWKHELLQTTGGFLEIDISFADTFSPATRSSKLNKKNSMKVTTTPTRTTTIIINNIESINRNTAFNHNLTKCKFSILELVINHFNLQQTHNPCPSFLCEKVCRI